MNNRVVILTLACLFATTAAAQEPATKPTLSHADLLRIQRLRQESTSPIVRRALAEEDAFRGATRREVAWMHSSVQHLFANSHRTLDDVRAKVLARMNADFAFVKQLNQGFSKLSPMNGEITWSCKTNKLVEILTEAIPFFEQHGELLMRGQLPSEFHYYWAHPRCLGPCETRTAGHNSRELALKASLLLLMLELEETPHVVDDSVASLEDSAFVHTTQLPKDQVLENINQLSFFYNGTLSPKEGELAFVHGGYAFGGQNDDSHFRQLGAYGKRFGPQDCSSWVSKLVGLTTVMSTIDYAQLYRDHFNDTHADASDTVHRVQPVQITRFDQVKPGMILVVRRYNLEQDPSMNTLGSSGHAQLIIDVDALTQTMITLEYNRDLPEREGFGVTRQSFVAPAAIKQMFFTTLEG